MDTIKQLSAVIESARAQNADADIVYSGAERLSLKATDGTLSEYSVSSTQTVGVRVVCGENVGVSYSENMSEPALQRMLTNALNNARYTRKSPDEKISAPSLHIETDASKTCLQDQLTMAQKTELALRLESEMQNRKIPAKAPYNGLYDTTSRHMVMNSNGVQCTHTERQVACVTSALISHDGKQSIFYGSTSARSFNDLNVTACIDDIYANARALLDGAPIETGRYDVIFSPDCLGRVLGAFRTTLSGVAAKKELTQFRGKEGESIASACLNLSDVPQIEGGLAYTPFDDEGYETSAKTIIRDGVLETLLHNSATANHFGLTTTGNASRSPKGQLDVSTNHLVIQAGVETDPTAGEYFEVIDLQGTHSGANAVSGDFSFGASGYLCRDGQRIKPVRGVTVAHNFYALLKSIEAVGRDQSWDSQKSLLTPVVRFGDCSVSGA
ncbi:MAG: TldD/PmbA family protein [Bradymonadia bacterium]